MDAITIGTIAFTVTALLLTASVVMLSEFRRRLKIVEDELDEHHEVVARLRDDVILLRREVEASKQMQPVASTAITESPP